MSSLLPIHPPSPLAAPPTHPPYCTRNDTLDPAGPAHSAPAPEALEPWEEAPTQKIGLHIPSTSRGAHVSTHAPPTLTPMCTAPGYILNVRNEQRFSIGAGCIPPLLLGGLTLALVLWLVQVLLGDRIPAYMTWWLVEHPR